MAEYLSVLAAFGLVFVTTLAEACVDYSGAYHREGYTVHFDQKGCSSLDLVHEYQGQKPVSEHWEVGSVAPINGWSWNNGNLAYTYTWIIAGKTTKTEVYTYTLDSAGNLIEHLIEYPANSGPIDSGVIAVYQRF